MATTVLIIDDDKKLAELLTDYLSRHQLSVISALDSPGGLDLLRKKRPDIVVLDVMLPQMSGFDVCKEIRKESRVPVIMLSARGEVTDKVVGLEVGADDYLSKPFDPRELVARIQTVLRRSGRGQDGDAFRCGELRVDIKKRSASLSGSPLNLTTMEFEILALFIKNPGAVLTRDEIMGRIQGIDWQAFNRSVDVAVSRLRQKLNDDAKSPRYLKTVWGSGYVFVGEVVRDEA